MESLVEAVLAGDSNSVASLLGDGLSPDSRDEGSTPLYTAAAQGEVELVALLLRAGADPNLRSAGEQEGTPLCAAACHGHGEIVRLLLGKGADPNLAEDEWWTPLRWAAAQGHAEVARTLLDGAANPDLGAPLAEAARRGSLAVARTLLAHGADPSETDPDGRTALEIAEDWAGKDVEGELVGRVELLAEALEHGRKGATLETTRTPLADGTERVSVQASFPDGRAVGADMETGHARIAQLLRGRRLPE
ncbi:MAG TPA: ankyrin repeat domain-containing protein [Gaiellaceae bacterium]|nr:ankyrin repeat domain-containing protein [Gaiellaceae bacterium]